MTGPASPSPPIRLQAVWQKALFVAAWWVVTFGANWLMEFFGMPALVALGLSIVFDLTAIAVGTRVFRGRMEPVVPPRVWWRATARPPAGFVISALLVFGAIGALSLVETGVVFGVLLVEFLVVAAFYLHSSIRLVRGDAPVPTRPRRNDDLRLINRKQRF